MARPAKQGQLPPKDTDPTIEGVTHDHDGTRDFHKGGDRDHIHVDGRPVFEDQALDPALTPDQPTGPGYIEAPEPIPGTSHADFFNGEAEAKAAEHRRQVAARHPHILTSHTNGQARPVDVTIAGVVHQLAALAEGKHFADLFAFETDAVIGFAQTLAKMSAQLADRRLVDTDLLGELKVRLDAWAVQRGLLPTPDEVEIAGGGS